MGAAPHIAPRSTWAAPVDMDAPVTFEELYAEQYAGDVVKIPPGSRIP